MVNENKLFGNLFDDKEITDTRLLEFGKDHVLRLTKSNTGGVFTEIIDQLNTAINDLEGEAITIDTTQNIRTGKTHTVDGVTAAFSKDMSNLEGVIAHALGGYNKPEFLEFYPHGLTEYNKPTREEMFVLTDRIYKAATKYATELGTTITAQLQAYKANFSTARSSQQGKIVDVETQRTIRDTNRTTLELGLTQSVHLVAFHFSGDVAKCASYVNFNLLYSQSHRPHVKHEGKPAANTTEVVANQTLRVSMDIKIKNTGTNADIKMWLAALATDAPNAHAIVVAPGKSKNLKSTDLGDLNHTFLLIHNQSVVNDAAYEVTIIG